MATNLNTLIDLLYSNTTTFLNNTLFNVSKNETGYEVEVLLAGVEKENIKIEYESSVLKISCDRVMSEKEYIHQGFGKKNHSLAIELGGIDFENSEGEFKDGILYLKLPKTTINSILKLK